MALSDDDRDSGALDATPDAALDDARDDMELDENEGDAGGPDLAALGDEEGTDSEGKSGGDDAEMGLGAEPHSADELADAALGRELRGKRGVSREDEGHAEEFLDRP